MSYWGDKGKYQKANDFLFKKLVPAYGSSGSNLGEALRLVSRVYYRHYNDGDTYSDCVHEGMVPEFNNGKFPFNGKHETLGQELEHLYYRGDYEGSMDLVLLHIMFNLSSDTAVYNPNSNRLAAIDSPAGKRALEALGLDEVFVNTCGKGEEWLPESLRREGVKIVKLLSPETLKELKCETLIEHHRPSKYDYGKKTKKVSFSTDRSILSKKFAKLEREHKKSLKAADKALKLRIKKMEEFKQKEKKLTAKEHKKAVEYYKELESLTSSKRADTLKKLINNKLAGFSHYTTKMLLLNLANQKAKKVATKVQRERRTELIGKLVKEINTIGKLTLRLLNYDPTNNMSLGLRSGSLQLSYEYTEKLDKLLVEIMGSEEAVDNLYKKCCRRY